MSQLDMFTPAAVEAEPLKHENLYLSADKKAKLLKLKAINKDRIINKLRKAAEDAIESEWKLMCKISGQEPDLGF